MKIKQSIFVSIILCAEIFFSCVVQAEGESSALVKGFAKYQAGRVENIILDGFISDLSNDQYLKRFFPQTSASIDGYSNISGKRLIPLMKYNVKQDLKSLKDFARCVKSKTSVLSKGSKNHETEKIREALTIIDSLVIFKYKSAMTISEFLGRNSCKEKLQVEDSLKARDNTRDQLVDLSFQGSSDKEKINTAIEDLGFKELAVIDADTKLQKVIAGEESDFLRLSGGLDKLTNELVKSKNRLNYLNIKIHAYVAAREKGKKLTAAILESAETVIDAVVHDDVEFTLESAVNKVIDSAKEASDARQYVEVATGSLQRLKDNNRESMESFIEILKVEAMAKTRKVEEKIQDVVNKKSALYKRKLREKIENKIDVELLVKAMGNIAVAYKAETDKSDENKPTFSVYVNQLVLALNALGFHLDDREGFRKFKNSSLFLASLADAANLGSDDSPEDIRNILGD